MVEIGAGREVRRMADPARALEADDRTGFVHPPVSPDAGIVHDGPLLEFFDARLELREPRVALAVLNVRRMDEFQNLEEPPRRDRRVGMVLA